MTHEEGKPAAPATPAAQPAPAAVQAAASSGSISYQEFQRLALRTGVIVSAQDHPNADRLLVLSVDLGEGLPRQLVAGIKSAYQASALVGKQVIVVANLEPAAIRGVTSYGMVLATQDASGLALVTTDRPIQAGSVVK